MNCRGRIATHFGSMEAYVSPRQIYMCVSIVERRERDRERERERQRERKATYETDKRRIRTLICDST